MINKQDWDRMIDKNSLRLDMQYTLIRYYGFTFMSSLDFICLDFDRAKRLYLLKFPNDRDRFANYTSLDFLN